jgi:predicted permease
MAMGRGFAAGEDTPTAPSPIAVISHGLWQRRFGGAADVVGRTIRIDAASFTIVGVAARDLLTSERADVWMPVASVLFLRSDDGTVVGWLRDPHQCCFDVVGRISSSATKQAATSELNVLSTQFRTDAGIDRRALSLHRTSYLGRREAAGILTAFALMFVAVTLLLLLACANVGNLLIARAAGRAREVGIRLSLGASRGRIVRQLFTESLVLAGLAGALSLVVAWLLPPLLLGDLGSEAFRTAPDRTVFAYAAVVALVACVAFGLAPAWHATSGSLNAALKDGTLSLPARLRVRSTLLGVQVAVSVVLIVAAGLLVRGVQHAATIDLGFAMSDVAVVSVDLPLDAYDGPRQRTFFQEVTRLLGSESLIAGFSTREPLAGGRDMAGMRRPGEPIDQSRGIQVIGVSRGYFEVLRVPIVDGRNFVDADFEKPLGIVNESLARLFWPEEPALGKTILYGERAPIAYEIVGVAKDTRTSTLIRVDPVFFHPFRDGSEPKLLIRTAANASLDAVAGRVTAIISGLDARARVRAQPLANQLDDELRTTVAAASVAGLLGVAALALATLGMVGVFAYAVRQREREIGIRLALGAQTEDVVKLVLKGSSRAMVVGLLAGVLGSIAAGQILERALFGLSPADPVAYGSAAALIALAGLVATYLPARRAARVDPMVALRCE